MPTTANFLIQYISIWWIDELAWGHVCKMNWKWPVKFLEFLILFWHWLWTSMMVKEIVMLMDAAISWLLLTIMHLIKDIQKNDRKYIDSCWNRGMHGVKAMNYKLTVVCFHGPDIAIYIRSAMNLTERHRIHLKHACMYSIPLHADVSKLQHPMISFQTH